MRISIDIGHPAHVHFFKHFIREMEKKGHECLITVIDKDITCALLEKYGFDYINHGAYGRSVLRKLSNIPIMDYKMYRTVKRFNPDIFLGVASFRAAHVATLMRKKCILFDDTETGKAERLLYMPFIDAVCTPSCYQLDLGQKQVRYEGYHELAYLHPSRFTPDPEVLKRIGVTPGEPFVVIRFVAWEAVHDLGHTGLAMEIKTKVVKAFSKYARVFISSEQPLPAEFESYRLTVSPNQIHDVMAYAALLYGESGTMSTEAAVLGTPAIFVHNAILGNMVELAQTYGGMCTFQASLEGQEKSLEKGLALLTTMDVKEQWQEKRDRLLNDKIDVTRWMMEFVAQRV